MPGCQGKPGRTGVQEGDPGLLLSGEGRQLAGKAPTFDIEVVKIRNSTLTERVQLKGT